MAQQPNPTLTEAIEKRSMVRLPTEKLARCLRSPRCAESERLAFLSLSGSLNPVHTQHTRALEVARTALERRGWTVVAGFLAPASGKFLEGELGSEAWPLEKRTRLCEAASGDSEWIDVCSWGEFRSYRLCNAIRVHLKQECAALRGRNLTGVELMGSDAAIRILDENIADWDSADPSVRASWYRGRVVCCLIRPGVDSAREKEHIERHTARRAADLGVELIVVDPKSTELPLKEVSSTDIRELLAAGDVEHLRARDWLHPDVLAALEKEVSVAGQR
jgi:nicotinic acid mononucleotide adenylyltransferase